jgi:hypothetical protein
LLRRFDDAFPELVPLLGEKGLSESLEIGLDTLLPVWIVSDGFGTCIVCSDGSAGSGGFSTIKFECVDGGFADIVGDSVNMFDFKVD